MLSKHQLSKEIGRTLSLLCIHIAVYAGLALYANNTIDLFDLIFAVGLVSASVSDFETFEIPDLASIWLFLTGIGASIWFGTDWAVALFGAAVWFVIFWTVHVAFRLLRGVDGLGFGDVKLVVGLSLWCGPVETVFVVLAASLSGLIALTLLSLRATEDNQENGVAFAPFLCLSAWVIWVF